MGRYLRAQVTALRIVFPQGPGTAAVGRKTRRFDFARHNRFFNRLFLLVFRMANFRTLSGRSGNGCTSAFLAQPARQHHRGNRDVHDFSSHLNPAASLHVSIGLVKKTKKRNSEEESRFFSLYLSILEKTECLREAFTISSVAGLMTA